MDAKIESKIKVGLATLYKIFPFLGPAIYAIELIEKREAKTIGIDKYFRIYYNPEFIDTLSDLNLVGVLFHEISHVILMHFKRLVNYPVIIANIAADLEINQVVREAGLSLPDDALFPEKFQFENHLLAEEYAELLIKKCAPPCLQGGEKNCENCIVVKIAGGMGMNGDCPKLNEGSGVTGREAEWEVGGIGNGYSETRITNISNEIIGKLKEGNTKSIGRGAGFLPRVVDYLLQSQIDWKRELKAVIIKIKDEVTRGKADLSRVIPSKRSFATGCVYPGLVKPLIKIGFLVDTSASMDNDEVAQGMTEAVALAKKIGCEVYVWQGDDSLKDPKPVVFSKWKIPKFTLRGYGGTAMDKCLKQISELPWARKLSAMIVFTDGLTRWPEENIMRMPVYVVLSTHLLLVRSLVPTWVKKVILVSKKSLKEPR